jgi:thymidylate synthase
MYITARTLDDLLRRVFEKLLTGKDRIKSIKGANTELTGVLLKITQPRARLSRTEIKGTLFSCLGELLWYLAKTNALEFVAFYLPKYEKSSDDGKTIYGGYGPRLFCMDEANDQVANVTSLLRKKPGTRQAVIQLFKATDIIEEHKDVPCTCTLQFMIRGQRLHMFTNMRSNDAFLGLPHDVFAFTMLQEIVARTLNLGHTSTR